MATRRRGFGSIRQLPRSKGARTGRWQASYSDPYGAQRLSRTGKPTPIRHNGPHTFDTSLDAEAWLVKERKLISAGTWTPPSERKRARRTETETQPLTFGTYAQEWLATRKVKVARSPDAPATNTDASSSASSSRPSVMSR